jgi:threonine aldolase
VKDAPVTPIDLRSDFLARPSPAMRQAAARAQDDPACFGLREDPWQRRLEAHVADLCGTEDALIFPTCTMANTAALLLQARPGSRVLTPPEAHVLVSEAGAGTAWGGLQLQPVPADPDTMAMPPLEAWEAAMAGPADLQRPPVQLCVVENTHNRAGGIALPAAATGALAALAQRHGVPVHLDGARLLFAAAALQQPVAALAAGCSTVTLSLNKSLGAPVAGLLAGRRDLIAEALVLRQRLGGGLRPVGEACAAALAGLQEPLGLEVVVAHARQLARGLADCPGLTVRTPGVASNLVVVALDRPSHAADCVAQLEAAGLRALSLAPGQIRFAVYRGVTADDITRAIAIVRQVMGRLAAPGAA